MKKILVLVWWAIVVADCVIWGHVLFRLYTPVHSVHSGTGIGYNAELASQIIRPQAVKPVSDSCALMMVWWHMPDSTKVTSIGCGAVHQPDQDTLFVASDFIHGISVSLVKIPRPQVDSLGELRPFGVIHKPPSGR